MEDTSTSTPLAQPATMPHAHWPGPVRALGFPDYRLLWIGQVVSNVGTWMQIMAQAWVVYEISHQNPFWLGADAFAAGLPIVLTPVSGVLADRVDRRRLMGAVTVLQALVAVFLALMYGAGKLQIWHILLCSVVSGTLASVMVPTFVSLMPDLVDGPALPNAIALNSLGFNVSRVLGPVVGGVVLNRWGATWSFGCNALSFAAVITALALIRTSTSTGHRKHARPLQSLRDGFNYTLRRRDLLVMFALSVITGLFLAPIMSMLPAYAHDVLGYVQDEANKKAYTILLIVFGLGGLLGAALLAIFSHRRQVPWRAFPILMSLGVVVILCGFTTRLVPAACLVFLAGAMMIGTLTRLNTAIVSSTPATMRGRVTGLFFLCIAGGQPIGGLAAGSLAKLWNTAGVYWVAGAMLVIAASIMGWLVRRYRVEFQGPLGAHAPTVAEQVAAAPVG